MGYYTGTATNHGDLLDKVRAHATTEGWTTNKAGLNHLFEKEQLRVTIVENVVGTGYSQCATKIETLGAGTYNLGVLPEYTSVIHRWRGTDSIISYHAFIDTGTTPCIYVSAEILPNVWRHFQFGIMEKVDTSEGGAFLFSDYSTTVTDWDSSSSGSLGIQGANQNVQTGVVSYTDDDPALVWGRYDDGTYATRRVLTSGYDLGLSGAINSFSKLIAYQPNNDTGESLIVPVEVFVSRSGDLWSKCGTLPNVALTNSQYISDAQTVSINADTWRLFPKRCNGFIADTGLPEESGYMGMAFKQ